MSTAIHSSDNSQRYVIPGRTGWAAVAKTVREIDEEKIRDCKEDIDTLLVFAGLFATALTAFLIESYHDLQEDQGTVMIGLLRDISSQTKSYAVSVSFFNSTVPQSAGVLPFKPTESAIRVNILWFASLILSLITASFGMLVKQWLREYLANEQVSPQFRLRVRHFRYPGLYRWKVFEIAALLPMLLQAALGLFLLGLCIFTWSVHPCVGLTSTPLVAGWAVFFILSLLGPVFFPRCPYKTNLSVRLLRPLQHLPYSSGRRISKFISLWPLSTSLFRWRVPAWASNLFSIITVSNNLDSNGQPRPPRNEEDALKNDSGDMTMVASVDEILMDDDIFGTALWEVVQLVASDPSQMLVFLREALHRRLQVDIPPDTLLDLHRLAKSGWEATMDIAADILSRGLDQRATSWNDWMKGAFMLLLSKSDHQMTKKGVKTLSRCLVSTDLYYARAYIDAKITNSDDYAGIIRRLQDSFSVLSSQDHMMGLFCIAQRGLFPGSVYVAPSQTVTRFMNSSLGGSDWDRVAPAVLDVVIACVHKQNEVQKWSFWNLKALAVVMSYSGSLPKVSAFITRFICSKWLKYAVICNATALSESERLTRAQETIVKAYKDSDETTRGQFIEALQDFLVVYKGGNFDERGSYLPINYVRVCLLFIQIFKEGHTESLPSSYPGIRTVCREDWQFLWSCTAKALQKFGEEEHSPELRVELRRLALDCLKKLDQLDCTDHGTDEFLASGTYLLPKELFTSLSSFIPPPEPEAPIVIPPPEPEAPVVIPSSEPEASVANAQAQIENLQRPDVNITPNVGGDGETAGSRIGTPEVSLNNLD